MRSTKPSLRPRMSAMGSTTTAARLARSRLLPTSAPTPTRPSTTGSCKFRGSSTSKPRAAGGRRSRRCSFAAAGCPVQGFQKEVLSPHHGLVDPEVLPDMVDASFQDALPLRVALGEVIAAKGPQDAAGTLLIEMALD